MEQGGKSFYVDLSTIRPSADKNSSDTSFTALTENEDLTYSVGEMTTSCVDNRVFSWESSTYSKYGKLIASTPQHEVQLTPVSHVVCNKPDSATLFSGVFQEQLALSLSLGLKNGIWKPSKIDRTWSGREPLHAHVLLDQEYVESGYRKAMLVVVSYYINEFGSDERCQACYSILTAIVFRESSGAWSVESVALDLDLPTAQEAVVDPKIKFLKLGDDRHAFAVADIDSDAHDSGSLETTKIFIPAGKKLYRVASFSTDSSEDRSDDGYVADAKTSYTFTPTESSAFYDLVLTTTGTEPGDNGPRVANKVQWCKFSDGHYKGCDSID